MSITITITKLRSYRLFSFAVFDFVASYIIFYLLAKYFMLPVNKMLLSVIPLSIIIHLAVGVPTELTKSVIAPKNKRDYVLFALVMINNLFFYS